MPAPLFFLPGRLQQAWLLATLAWAAPASAFEYQYHGFAAQGFALSEGNNVYGESTEGSFKLYEAGLNGTVSLRPDLLASAQLLVRDAGETDNEGLRLDYALVDYQFLSTPAVNAGVRAGRVKNAFGLFNETRDVVFARPGITLPQSIYLESFGFRRIIFSSDGGQLYGGVTHGDHYTSLVAAASANRSASEDEKRQLFTGADEITFDNFVVARLQDEISGGNWRYALSYLQTDLNLAANLGGFPVSGKFDIQLYVLSVRHDGERYAVTAEYELMRSKGQFTGAGSFVESGDGAYLQLDYRLAPQWMLSGRYDASFSNRNDRSGRDEVADPNSPAFGQDRHSRFARDSMLGLNWRPDEHWGLWGEFHLIDGTSSVSAADNPDNASRPADKHWNSFLLMAAYRF